MEHQQEETTTKKPATGLWGWIVGASFVELLIPLGDFLPSYSVTAFILYRKMKKTKPDLSWVDMFFVIAVAVTNDIIDWMLVGAIPIAGDALDLFTTFILSFWLFIKK